MRTKSLALLVLLQFAISLAFSQEKLYPNTFPLGDVVLLDGPFKHARDLNVKVILQYDVNRLLAPYRKEAGLSEKAKSYENWIGLDGHVGGHYLTALAFNYAATGDTACKRLLDKMVSELKACQDANTAKYPEWAAGYVGGVPNSNAIWPEFKKGNFGLFWKAWVPWYNLHKTYSGLRDAWLYGKSEEAKTIFLKFCDWCVNITSDLSDAKMDEMLGNEHGGMNEVLADACQMTGDAKYLAAAKRFSHKILLNAMAVGKDNLDNVHANTQVPKAVGFQRIAEVSGDINYSNAGSFFWETVTGKRSLASGGNSRREFFPTAATCSDYISMVEGPESCNTNNMLKLTEDLFRIHPSAKYADFYERALFNHILSTQHPDHGGYVYFTPARPRHYRVYSAPNEAMWCCVGTGMENHGKYGEFIYTHKNDSLFVNLFIASELNWKEKGIKIKQETNFPYSEETKLSISGQSQTSLKLLIRYPAWVAAGALKVLVNDQVQVYTEQPSSYIAIDRKWSNGDVVKIVLPMHNSIEQLPNVPSYIAFMHGPILLGAKTGKDDLTGLVADNSRWGHIAGGKLLPLDKAPILIEDDRSKLVDKLVPVAGKPLTFTFSGLNIANNPSTLELEPFFKIHDSRYMMYWMNLSNVQYKAALDSMAKAEARKLALESRTIDFVQPGQQQPEVDHAMQVSNSHAGNYMDEFWRDATDGGFFSYKMSTNKLKNLSLMVRYWGNESGNRTFEIWIDDIKLTTENIVGKWNVSSFKDVEYAIPSALLKGKSSIRVKFQAPAKGFAGSAFYVRLVKPAVQR